MQFGFLCKHLHTGTVKNHRNQHRRCLGWDMNLAVHQHKSEVLPHVPTYLVFQKKELNYKRGFSVFLSVETRLLVCKEVYLWKWRAQGNIVICEKWNKQFRTLHDGNNKVLRFMKLRWAVQVGEWGEGGGGGGRGGRRGGDSAHRNLLAQNRVKWRDLWAMLKFGFCYQRFV